MLESNSLQLLLIAAKNPKNLTIDMIAERVGVREEAITSNIRELEQIGLLNCKNLIHGMELSLTPRGRLSLSNLKGEISSALGDRSVLRGTVQKGKGEGRYCISTETYNQPIALLLGADPYEGTLNLEVEESKREEFLSKINSQLIDGAQSNYGTAKFYPVIVGGRKCGLLIGTREEYPKSKVELVDTLHLRSALQLQDGDVVTIERV